MAEHDSLGVQRRFGLGAAQAGAEPRGQRAPVDRDLAQRRQVEGELATSIGRDLLALYTGAVRTQAGISLNQAAINAVHAQMKAMLETMSGT